MKRTNIRLILDDGGWYTRHDELDEHGSFVHISVDDFLGEVLMKKIMALALACERFRVDFEDIEVIDRTRLAYMH